jgi:hypothetical protein
MPVPVPSWQGLTTLSEIDTSPEIVLGERVTVTRTFHGPHQTCLRSAPGRGARGTGIAAGLFVAESQIKRERGGRGVLIIRYEPSGQFGGGGLLNQTSLPPNEYYIDQDRFDRPLEKNLRYSDLSEYAIGAVQSAVRNPDGIWGEIFRSPEDFPNQTRFFGANFNRLIELYKKLIRGFTTYSIYPPVMRLVSYSISFPNVSGGGFREFPPLFPTLPRNFEFLRQADKVAWNGSHWRLEKSWVGGPDLDHDVYPAA